MQYIQIFLVALKLGVTSFGGPTAHIAYFHDAYVKKHQWLDDGQYTQLVALAQFLPGPASSQVGFAIGVLRGGLLGGLFAFIGFTLPSVVALIIFAKTMDAFSFEQAIHSLKLVAVAVVAHAVYQMAPKLAQTTLLQALVVFSLITSLLWQHLFTQVVILLIAALIAMKWHHDYTTPRSFTIPISPRVGTICLVVFTALLCGLPLLRTMFHSEWLALFDHFYRAGAFVFGGGHVVLPLLQHEFTGMLSEHVFLAGYGLTQAMPGPLFTFASYIGAVLHGWTGGLVATVAIFLPGLLLMLGVLPFWQILQRYRMMNRAFAGINAAVVGLLLAALYTPIFTSSVTSPIDMALVVLLFSLLQLAKASPLVVVLVALCSSVLR